MFGPKAAPMVQVRRKTRPIAISRVLLVNSDQPTKRLLEWRARDKKMALEISPAETWQFERIAIR